MAGVQNRKRRGALVQGWTVALVAALVAFHAVGCGDDDDPAPPAAGNNTTGNNTNNTTGSNNNTSGTNNNTSTNNTTGTNNNTPNLCGDEGVSCLDEGGAPDLSLCPPRWSCMAGCCVEPFACADDDTCAGRAGTDTHCKDARYDCQCNEDTGACFTFVCTVNTDCASGELCADGVCAPAPAATGLQARILTQPRVLVQGETLALQVVAFDPANPALTLTEGVTFEVVSSDGAIVSADGLSLTAGGTAGTATLTVKVSGNAADPGDTLELTTLAAPAADTLRVTVLNDTTLAPLEGATVILHGDPDVALTTDAAGQVSFAGAGADATVTVLAAGYGYMTIAGASKADLLFPLSQNIQTEVPIDEDTRELDFSTLENVDVVSGTVDFRSAINLGEIEVALSGFGIGAGLLDLNFELITGPNIPQYFPTNSLGLPTDEPTEIPGGVVLNLNRQPLVRRYALIGREGQPIMWSLGGRVSLIENPNLVTQIIGAIGGNFNVGSIVAAVLPFFRNFYSGLRTDITLGDSPQLPVRDDVDLALKVPTAIPVTLAMPPLPQAGGQFLEGVVVLGGALVDGQGFVPLGITAALDRRNTDEPADGIVDGDSDASGDQDVRMNMSPLHSGVLGPNARYAMVAVALRFDTSGGVGEATSVMLTTVQPGAAIPANPTLPREAFLGFGEGSTWGDPEDAGDRTLAVAAPAGAELVRTVFEGSAGQKWVVWAPAAQGDTQLPNPADYNLADPTTSRRVRVQAITLRPDTGASFDDLIDAGGLTLRDIIDVAEAFSLVEIP